jgi:hypothetical protein
MEEDQVMSKAPHTEERAPAVINVGVPAHMIEDMAQYSGAGLSERTQDFQVPFLMIAQSGSPQVKPQQPDKYIEGLRVGDIFNSATGKFWRGSEGLLVCQSYFQKAMVEWITRDDGSGWVATHPIDTPLVKQARWGGKDDTQLLLPNGHQLVDTSYHFVADAETGEIGVVSMASTSLGCSRTWQTLIKGIKVPGPSGNLVVAPAFSRVYRLSTRWKQNAKGDWFLFNVADEGWAPEVGYKAARAHFLEVRDNGVVMGRPPLGESGGGPTIDSSADTPI